MTDSDIILRVEGLSKAFGGKPVLSDATFTQRRGTLKVLVGPSGGGKSTLLQCINYLIPPDQGRVWLDGRQINPKSRRELSAYRQEVGMIFQDFNLFDHLTAIDNVTVGLRKVKKLPKNEARARAEAELARVGLADKTTLYPAELSGGKRNTWEKSKSSVTKARPSSAQTRKICASVAPLRFWISTVETSCPAALSLSAPRLPRFSSSLNFTPRLSFPRE